jgi:membrane protein
MVKNKIVGFVDYLNKNRLTTVAGAWVFFFLTSVVPIAFLIVTAFGVFGVSVTQDLISRLPIEFRAAGEVIATTAERASKGATVLFIGSVILSCTTLLNQMSKDGDAIYGVNAKHKRGLFRRAWAFAALAVLFLTFLALAFVFAFGSALIRTKLYFRGNKTYVTIAAFTLIILFGFLVIMALNKFISPIRLKIKDVWLGSFVSLFIIVIGTIGFILYLRFFNAYNAFYGSLAAIIVFLLWAYILMIGLVFGVIVNSKRLKKEKILLNNKLLNKDC